MDRASFRPLAELGISPPSIVAIQRPSGDQAISLMRSPVKLTDTPPTYGCLTGNRLRISKALLRVPTTTHTQQHKADTPQTFPSVHFAVQDDWAYHCSFFIFLLL